jgi:hypothetical protein
LGSWGEILREFNESARARAPQGLGPDSDGIRLKYIQRLRDESGRAVIVYASGWVTQSGIDSITHSVEQIDVHALMEVCHGVDERELDLVIHSPGGSPQAAEQMVNYLRTQFDYIRAFVPMQAKSAATMIALGCDEIVMGRHSELGPIDPQILVPVPEGRRYAPAIAILRDFRRAQSEVAADVNTLPAWTPILRSYIGGMVEFCTQQITLAQEVVAGWLEQHMLAHPDAKVPKPKREQTAVEIAAYFGSEYSYDRFRTHGRPMRIEELQKVPGLVVRELEADNALQDAVLSIYHALDLTFGAPVLKIVENHLGARFVRVLRQAVVPVGGSPPGEPGPEGQSPPTPRPQPPNPRAERRRQERQSKRR